MSNLFKPCKDTIKGISYNYYIEHPDPEHECFYEDYDEVDHTKCGKIVEIEVDPDEYIEIYDEYDGNRSVDWGEYYFHIDPYVVAKSLMENEEIFYTVNICDELIPASELCPVFGYTNYSRMLFAKTSLRSFLNIDDPTFFGRLEVNFDPISCFKNTRMFDIGWLEDGEQLEYRGNDIAIFKSFTGFGEFCIILKMTDVHSKEDFNKVVNTFRTNFISRSNALLEKEDPDDVSIRKCHKWILRALVDESNEKEIKSYIGISETFPERGLYTFQVLRSVDSSENCELHEETIDVKKYYWLDDNANIFLVVAEDAEYFVEVQKK